MLWPTIVISLNAAYLPCSRGNNLGDLIQRKRDAIDQGTSIINETKGMKAVSSAGSVAIDESQDKDSNI